MFRMVRIFALVLPGIMAAATGTLTQTFEFNQKDFVFDKVNGYDVVCLPGAYSTTEPGSPNLPLAVCNFVIPPDAEITGADVVSVSTTALPGEFNIHPSQRPQVLSKPALPFVAPDPTVYGTDRTYPSNAVTFAKSGLMGGFRIAGYSLRRCGTTRCRSGLSWLRG